MTVGKQSSDNSSRPLTERELETYFNRVNALSGGRLDTFATQGTPAVGYEQLSAEDIRALGGMGATREASAQRAQGQSLEQIGADPSLSVFQRQRARQLTNQDYRDQLDAIAKETEAAITGLKSQEAGRGYQADVANAQRLMADMEALASIYFGAKGNESKSKASGWNVGLPQNWTGGGGSS